MNTINGIWQPVGGGHYNAKMIDAMLVASPENVGSAKYDYMILALTEDAQIMAMDFGFDGAEQAQDAAERAYAEMRKGE